jgi:hypothetical protein
MKLVGKGGIDTVSAYVGDGPSLSKKANLYYFHSLCYGLRK